MNGFNKVQFHRARAPIANAAKTPYQFQATPKVSPPLSFCLSPVFPPPGLAAGLPSGFDVSVPTCFEHFPTIDATSVDASIVCVLVPQLAYGAMYVIFFEMSNSTAIWLISMVLGKEVVQSDAVLTICGSQECVAQQGKRRARHDTKVATWR